MFLVLLLALSQSRRHRHSRRHSSRNGENRVLTLLPDEADDIDGSYLLPKFTDPKSAKLPQLREQRVMMRQLENMFQKKAEMEKRLLTATRQALAEDESYLHEALLNLYARLAEKKQT